MRDVINKNVSEEELLRATEAAFKAGWMGLKLYFMFGLPTETEADLDGTLELLYRVRSNGIPYSRRPIEIRASLACFVPKAHTPFQWQAQASIEMLEEKRHYMLKRKIKNVKLSFHDSQTSFLEGVMARGDRRLGEVIYQAWQRGCKFDGWSEYFRFSTWMQVFADCQIDPNFYIRERSYDELFPWDFIDTGVSKAYLRLENERALQGISTPDCRTEDCVGCGVCPHFEIAPFHPWNRDISPSVDVVAPSLQGTAILVHPWTSSIWILRRKSDMRLRAEYSVGRNLQFLANLDMMHLMERALRRAAIPCQLTEGFNPHIKLSMGTILPVGVWGKNEYFDLDTGRDGS